MQEDLFWNNEKLPQITDSFEKMYRKETNLSFTAPCCFSFIFCRFLVAMKSQIYDKNLAAIFFFFLFFLYRLEKGSFIEDI